LLCTELEDDTHELAGRARCLRAGAARPTSGIHQPNRLAGAARRHVGRQPPHTAHLWSSAKPVLVTGAGSSSDWNCSVLTW
jgi:hypothetical protein